MIVINSLSGGGAERSMNILASSLLDHGISIQIVAVNKGKPDYFTPNCPIEILGREWKGGILATFASAYKLRKKVREFQPDVSIINCELPELLWIFSPRNFEFLVVEHTTKPWNNRKKLGLIVRKILNERGARWISVSVGGPIWPTKMTPFRVIPNPIKLPRSIEDLGFKEDVKPPRLVFLGRLDKGKNPFTFIDICIATGIPGLIIGAGPMESELKLRISQEKVQIEMLGYRENPWDSISKNDIFVVTSDYEGDGMVVLEALEFGVNLIAADNPDLRRINLPENNYAKSISEFKTRIFDHLAGENPLNIDDVKVDKLLSPRNVVEITKSWLKIL
jgi:glycosyltransferase involved in cell wall biosynthesis